MPQSRMVPNWSGLPARRLGLSRRDFPVAGPRVGLRLSGNVLRTVLVLLPTILAGLYFGAIATDRYVSEARFVVRSAKPTTSMGGLGALLQLAGLSRSQDDAYAVHDFLTSRDAMHQLTEQLDLRAIYNHPDADFVARYPSVFYGKSDEALYRYFERMLSVVVSNSTGLTTIRVQAFRAEDARKIAAALLDLGEGLVNKLNQRMQADAVEVAAAEVARAEQHRVERQIEITEFRNKELILDPGKTSAMVVELIGKLSAQLADTRADLAEMQGNSPNSPQLQMLRMRADAIEHQIAVERGRVASSSDGLADKIATYERLVLEREFSIRALAQATVAEETARVEARRQQIYLERVVDPDLPDEAMMPRRWRMALTIFGFNVIGAAVLWLIAAGLREHASQSGR